MSHTRKSSFTHLLSPMPHKSLPASSPTTPLRPCIGTHPETSILHRTNSADEELNLSAAFAIADLRSSLNDSSTEERDPMVSLFFDEENEDDEELSNERELYLEAEEEFRELMGCGLAYVDAVHLPRKSTIDHRSSFGLADSGEEFDTEPTDLDIGFPRLGFSPEPTLPAEPAWKLEPPPLRATNPITKNEIFGVNGVVADVAVVKKVSKMLVPPLDNFYFNDAHPFYNDAEDQDNFWSSRRETASWTPPRRRARINSEPVRKFWQSDDWVQCC